MKKIAYILMLFVAFFAAFSARDYNINNRVPHADEGEQASVFLNLLKDGNYSYNPNGPHGPTFYYYAANAAKISGLDDAPAMRTADLRKLLTPVLFLIFAAYILSSRNLGRGAAWWACACFAMSALGGIYSAYFVHEIIFAFAVFALAQSVWRFASSPSFLSAAAVGAFAGLAQATKETSLISFAAVAVAFACAFLFDKTLAEKLKNSMASSKMWKFLCAGLIAFAFVFTIFYSSFGDNMRGVCDAFASYAHFWDKSGAQEHSGPFAFYFGLLALQKSSGAWFGELPITILAAIGLAFAFKMRAGKKDNRKAAYIVYLAANAAFVIFTLSLVTYKTPWLILSPMVFVCGVAGFGIERLLARKNIFTWIAAAVFVCGMGWWQYKLESNAMRRYNSDPRNPFIYAHTVSNYSKLLNRINGVEKVSEYGNDIPIAFITTQSTWPLPWDLRDYPNAGYWNGTLPQNIEIFDIIACDSSMEDAVRAAIDRSQYVEEFYGLRENYILILFIKKDLFEKAIL